MPHRHPHAQSHQQDGDSVMPKNDSEPSTTQHQQELATCKSDYLRLAADFDNFRKRTLRESEQRAAAEKEAFIQELLPVVDNLERALASERTSSSDPFYQGVEMTRQQLVRLLQAHGLEAVEDVGVPFNPHQHEAISTRQDTSQPDDVVLEVIQRGYRRHGKIFRPAKVIVNTLNSSDGVNHGH